MQKFGRYEFDPLQVIAAQQVTEDQFEISLPHGVKFVLNAEEKAQVDAARSGHQATMYVYGVARAAGLRG